LTSSLVSPELRAKVRNAAVPVALAMGRAGLTPNALTLIGFGISVIAAWAALEESWLLAGLLVIGGGVFDLFDGALARAQHKVSRLGAYMDSVFDRAGEAVVFVGIVGGLVEAGWDTAPFLAAAALAELAHEESEAKRLAAASCDPHSPWHRVDGWQLNTEAHHDFVFIENGVEHPLRVRLGDEHRADASKVRTIRDGHDWHVLRDGVYRRFTLKSGLSYADEHVAGSLTAPMPGRIVKVMAKEGTTVKKGEALLILEAMKMEHTITAPADGTVKNVHFRAGEQVLEGAELVTLVGTDPIFPK